MSLRKSGTLGKKRKETMTDSKQEDYRNTEWFGGVGENSRWHMRSRPKTHEAKGDPGFHQEGRNPEGRSLLKKEKCDVSSKVMEAHWSRNAGVKCAGKPGEGEGGGGSGRLGKERQENSQYNQVIMERGGKKRRSLGNKTKNTLWEQCGCASRLKNDSWGTISQQGHQALQNIRGEPDGCANMVEVCVK